MNRLYFAMLFLIAIIIMTSCAPSTLPPTLPLIGEGSTRGVSTPTLVPTFLPPTATRVPPTSTIAAPTETSLPPTPTRTPLTSPPPVSIKLNLDPGKDTDQSPALATFTAQGNKTEITVAIKPGVSGVAQPVYLQEGTCSRLGILRFTLTEIVNGKSTTVVNASLETLFSGVMALTVRKSAQENSAYVACGVIPEGLFVKLESGTDGDQSGTVVAFGLDNQTEVDMFIKPGPAGIVQPGFIWLGYCNDLIALRYALNPIVGGESRTVFDVPFSVFKKEKGAIVVHKSLQELEKNVACGMLVPESFKIER